MSDAYNTRIKLKRDTEANWTSKNPVLLDGEMVIVKTTDEKTRKKIGDGTKKFSELPYDETTVDDALSGTSTNPLQNKVVKVALDNKANIDSPTFTSKMALKTSNGGKVECTNASYTDEKGAQFAGIQLSSQEGGSTGLVAIGGIKTPDPNTDGSTDTAVSVAYLNEQLLFKAGTSVATQDANGLMSANDKKKLDGIADEAKNITVDSALSSTSANPVQNKAVKSALDGKAGTTTATQSANGLMSSSDKTKLDGIASGANKTTVDSVLSNSSTNPVQNKVVKSALDGKLSTSGGTLTGNLTGQYLTGTWLQSTSATDLAKASSKIAVLDDSGWVYYRTTAEIKSDLGITDYVESQGATGSWTWRKWASGIAEMWATFEATSLTVDNAWGSVYYGSWMNSTINKNGRKYPFAFTSVPFVTATPYSSSTDFWLLTDSANNLGTPQTYAPAYACVLPGKTTISNPKIHYYVTGKYK